MVFIFHCSLILVVRCTDNSSCNDGEICRFSKHWNGTICEKGNIMYIYENMFYSSNNNKTILKIKILINFVALPLDIYYTPPTKQGYCSINTRGVKHEHCRCYNSNEDINNCREMCDVDSKCKAYSFRDRHSECYLYTTSSCTKECKKRNYGKLGNILERQYAGASGCYIKHKSKIVYQN